ncbi:MAG: flavodoxin family protein [Lachnospiraceae bacterium]|nr:flavodoxin family protein [Lachnospiraceae bacterium]MBR1598642.1 flavodoxin family protein [Lachnospiraceae bacterium]
MKVLGIVGSLRKGGNTEFAVQSALKSAQDLGADVEEICLTDYKIYPCDGCGKCKTAVCHLDDGMKKLLPKIAEADALIIGSPVYYGGISGGLKCLLDRCRPLKLQGNQLSGKIGGAIAVGKVWGHANVIDTILHFFGSQGMIAVPIKSNPGIGAQIIATKYGDAEKDINGIKAVQELGKQIVENTIRLKEDK